MKHRTAQAVLILLFAGTAVLAHQGVTDPNVRERMAAMKRIGDATKTLGLMIRGKVGFDRDALRAAALAIAAEAGRTPDLFEARGNDPMTEADPAIWQNWADFDAKADRMREVALTLAAAGTPDDLRAGFADLGASCRACHEAYRIPD